jgi:hypothetical protein
MKKLLVIALSVLLLMICICACGGNETAEPTEPKFEATATDADIALLDNLYKGREAYFGDMHNHS